MKLRFLAREDQLVRIPGAKPLPGQPDMYVGRTFDAASRGYPATKDGYECDADSDGGRRLARLCRIDGSLFPANAETAAACGVSFAQTEFKSGVHVVASSKPSKPAKDD